MPVLSTSRYNPIVVGRAKRHRQAFLTPADGAEVRYLPVQTGPVQQALCHSRGLVRSQIEQTLIVRQN